MVNLLLFILTGAISGLLTAYALDLTKPKELLQGAVGGIIAGLGIGLLMPK
ncbi:MAG: hypothetical protein ACYDG6_06045 [Thermincolia bacterium]